LNGELREFANRLYSMIPEEREPLDRLFDLLVEAVARELVESAFTDRVDRYELSAKKSPELLRPRLINF
jgi:hypothetical protein